MSQGHTTRFASLIGRLLAVRDLLDPVDMIVIELERARQLAAEVSQREQELRGEFGQHGLAQEFDRLEDPPRFDCDALLKEWELVRDRLAAALTTIEKDLKQFRNETIDGLAATGRDLEARLAALEALAGQLRERLEAEAAALAQEQTSAFEGEPTRPIAEGPERRRHPRESSSLEFRIEGANRLLAASSENLSVGGVFIETTDDVELGTLLHISCSLPGGRVVEADGVVAWKREGSAGQTPGVGIEFLAMAEEDREALEQLGS